MSSSIKLLSMSAILFATAPVFAQRTEDGRRGATANSVDSFVAKLMAFDKNHDGKLTKDEITDDRLLPLFERADADHDGVVTVKELKALYAAESETLVAQGPDGRDRGGPPDDGGPGGPDGPGPGGPRWPRRPCSRWSGRLWRATSARPNHASQIAGNTEAHRRPKEGDRRIAEGS